MDATHERRIHWSYSPNLSSFCCNLDDSVTRSAASDACSMAAGLPFGSLSVGDGDIAVVRLWYSALHNKPESRIGFLFVQICSVNDITDQPQAYVSFYLLQPNVQRSTSMQMQR